MTAPYYPPFASAPERRAAFAAGMWIRLALVGILLLVGGLAAFVEGSTHAAGAILVAIGGASLAALSWRKIHVTLTRLDAPVARKDETIAAPPRALRTAAG